MLSLRAPAAPAAGPIYSKILPDDPARPTLAPQLLPSPQCTLVPAALTPQLRTRGAQDGGGSDTVIPHPCTSPSLLSSEPLGSGLGVLVCCYCWRIEDGRRGTHTLHAHHQDPQLRRALQSTAHTPQAGPMGLSETCHGPTFLWAFVSPQPRHPAS
jgi:hypothetical protein